jgi:hypothetical protein
VSKLHHSWQQQQQQQLLLLQQQRLPPLLSQPQRTPGLHLASFSGDGPGVADIVAVLPAHSLTRLSMSLVSSKSVDAAALSAALARLSSLQQLQATSLPVSCLPALGQLSHLTHLELNAEGYHDTAANADPEEMLHLAQLEVLKTTAGLAADTVLPAQLQRLSLPGCRGCRLDGPALAAVMHLQQLTFLSFEVGFREQAPLLRLAQLPALQQLCLEYDLGSQRGLAACVATSPAWAKLPQLRELVVCDVRRWPTYRRFHPTRQQTEAIVASIAAATNLTRLSLSLLVGRSDALEGELPCLQWLADMVSVLPVHSLTHLRVSAPFSDNAGNGAALSAAMVCLSSMQQLEVDCLPVSCWPALGQLSHLTHLELCAEDVWHNAAHAAAILQQLPPLLRRLRLDLGAADNIEDLPLDMGHLTQLEKLDLTAGLAEGTVLPPQLQRLSLPHYPGYRLHAPALAAVMHLQQLTFLSFGMEYQEQELLLSDLLRLAQLPALQQLCLQYQIYPVEGLGNFLAMSSAWAKLPQLRELSVYAMQDGTTTMQQTAAILADVAAATTLTKLSLSLACPRDAHEVDVCRRLAGLTGLKHLVLGCSPLGVSYPGHVIVPCDNVLALTALSGLTWLNIYRAFEDVGAAEAATTALADKLTRLRHLELK